MIDPKKNGGWRDAARIVTIGQTLSCGIPYIELNEKYGFHKSNISCLVTSTLLRGIDVYNAEIEEYLNKKIGHDWCIRYRMEMDSLILNNPLE